MSDIERLGGDGILTPSDIEDLKAGVKQVFMLMRDGLWHKDTEIIEASGQREGLRRMRELRQWFTVERCRIQGRRAWNYRLAPKSGDLSVHHYIAAKP